VTPEDPRAVRYESVGHYFARVPPGSGAAPLVVAVHGYRQPPEEMLRYATSVAPEDAVVLAPVGPSAFYLEPEREPARRGVGHGWSADPRREDTERRNDAFLLACCEAVARERPVDPRRTVLLGYSQGVGVATHFWASHPATAVGLVSLAGGVREDVRPRLATLRGRKFLQVRGERDALYHATYEAALADRMRGMGIEVETLALDAGHGLLAPARERVRDWIARAIA
jgi:predicted esterase